MVYRSTTMGSLAKAEAYRQAPTPAYKISKAALNMLTVQYAQQYEADGFTFVAVTPGVSFRKSPQHPAIKLHTNCCSGCVPTSAALEPICPWRQEQRRLWISCNKLGHIRMGNSSIFMCQAGRMRRDPTSMMGRR